MDQLEAALNRITHYLQQVYGLVEEVFSPGLSKDEIDKRLQNFPFCVPHEVVQLYQYGNGVRETITYVGRNFVIDELLSLDEALREYARLIAFSEEMAKEWDEEPSETWEPQWFPLTQLDLFYHVIQCAPTPQATGPVYYVSRKEDYTVTLAYDSVTSMMETIATCCEMGAYRVATDGVMREDPWLVAEVKRALNPQRTAWWFTQVPGARTIEELVPFLKHPSRQQFDGGIAAKAAEALCELRDPQTIDPLIHTLKDDDDFVRRQAAWILYTFCDARTVEPFLQALGDRDQVVRVQAVAALGEFGDRRAVMPLIEALRDPEYLVRQNAAMALGKLGDMHAVVPLIEALDDPAMAVRANAIWSLGRLGDAKAIAPLLQAMDEPELLGSAIHALGELRTPHAVPKLIRILESAADPLRQAAAEALGKIGDPWAVEVLLQVLQNPNHPACHDAVQALGKIGDPRALEPLSYLFHVQDRLLQRYARAAWDKIQYT